MLHLSPFPTRGRVYSILHCSWLNEDTCTFYEIGNSVHGIGGICPCVESAMNHGQAFVQKMPTDVFYILFMYII